MHDLRLPLQQGRLPVTAGNLTLRGLIEALEEIEASTPDAIPTAIGRDGRESLVSGAVVNDVGPGYVNLMPGHEVV